MSCSSSSAAPSWLLLHTSDPCAVWDTCWACAFYSVGFLVKVCSFGFLESWSQVPAGSPHSAVALEKAVAEAVGRIPARCELWRLQAAGPGFYPLWNTRPLSEGLSLFRTPGAGSMEASLAIGPSSNPHLLCRTRGHLMYGVLEGQSEKKKMFLVGWHLGQRLCFPCESSSLRPTHGQAEVGRGKSDSRGN